VADETYYTVLGVSESATQQEIRAAYRSLVKKIHPDSVATLSRDVRYQAEQLTKEINEAYSVLSHADLRSLYDQQLAEYRQPANVASPTPPHTSCDPSVSQPGFDSNLHSCGPPMQIWGSCLRYDPFPWCTELREDALQVARMCLLIIIGLVSGFVLLILVSSPFLVL